MSDINQTGDLTSQQPPTGMVNPAPATQNISITPSAPAAPPTIDPSIINKYEDRVRALMSEKDKTRAEYERAVAERLELQKKIDEFQANQQAVVSGAAKATEEALNRAKEMETQLQSVTAEKVKLAKLMQHPELAAYAALIPATTDEAKIEEVINNLKEIRERDIAAATQAYSQSSSSSSSSTSSSSSSFDYPKNSYIPPASPAKPAATSSTDTAQSLQDRLNRALEEYRIKGDPAIFEKARDEAWMLAQAQIQQQGGR